jgi:hypothetical protein
MIVVTLQELFDRFVEILQTRLELPINKDLEEERNEVAALQPEDLQKNPEKAQGLLDAIAADAAANLGACVYTLGGHDFCLVCTSGECDGLAPSTFTEGKMNCALPHWPPTVAAPSTQVGGQAESTPAP